MGALSGQLECARCSGEEDRARHRPGSCTGVVRTHSSSALLGRLPERRGLGVATTSHIWALRAVSVLWCPRVVSVEVANSCKPCP